MKNNILKSLLLLFTCFVSCIDPVSPEFEFSKDLVFIEAFASTIKGSSFVTVNESVLDSRGRYSNVFINDAQVTFKNSQTNEIIPLLMEREMYFPPIDFVVSVGDSWELNVVFSDGREYQSLPETVLEPVEISALKATYNPVLLFRDDFQYYVPGHSVSVNFDEPAGQENYYYWRMRSYEKINYCEKCHEGIFRDGICVENPLGSNRKKYYDYFCESDCWQIRHSESIQIFDDQFSNGKRINELPLADVLLYSKKDILVEVQQFSLSSFAHDYYKILKDIIDNSSGFNAPPPAALLGNLFNPNNSDEFVLGRFTAASATAKTIFIERGEITENQLDQRPIRLAEECGEVCPAQDCMPGSSGPCKEVRGAPCKESRFRTSITPKGWIE